MKKCWPQVILSYSITSEGWSNVSNALDHSNHNDSAFPLEAKVTNLEIIPATYRARLLI